MVHPNPNYDDFVSNFYVWTLVIVVPVKELEVGGTKMWLWGLSTKYSSTSFCLIE